MANRTSNRAMRRVLVSCAPFGGQIRISNRKIMQIRKGLLYITTWANTRNPSASQNRAAKRSLNQMTEWECAE